MRIPWTLAEYDSYRCGCFFDLVLLDTEMQLGEIQLSGRPATDSLVTHDGKPYLVTGTAGREVFVELFPFETPLLQRLITDPVGLLDWLPPRRLLERELPRLLSHRPN